MKNMFQKAFNVLKCSIPIIFAGAVAVVQAIGEQKEQRRIDDMEKRIKELESEKDEES